MQIIQYQHLISYQISLCNLDYLQLEKFFLGSKSKILQYNELNRLQSSLFNVSFLLYLNGCGIYNLQMTQMYDSRYSNMWVTQFSLVHIFPIGYDTRFTTTWYIHIYMKPEIVWYSAAYYRRHQILFMTKFHIYIYIYHGG